MSLKKTANIGLYAWRSFLTHDIQRVKLFCPFPSLSDPFELQPVKTCNASRGACHERPCCSLIACYTSTVLRGAAYTRSVFHAQVCLLPPLKAALQCRCHTPSNNMCVSWLDSNYKPPSEGPHQIWDQRRGSFNNKHTQNPSAKNARFPFLPGPLRTGPGTETRPSALGTLSAICSLIRK